MINEKVKYQTETNVLKPRVPKSQQGPQKPTERSIIQSDLIKADMTVRAFTGITGRCLECTEKFILAQVIQSGMHAHV